MSTKNNYCTIIFQPKNNQVIDLTGESKSLRQRKMKAYITHQPGPSHTQQVQHVFDHLKSIALNRVSHFSRDFKISSKEI